MKTLLSCLMLVLFLASCKKSTNSTDDENQQEVELITKTITSGLINPWEIIYGPDNFIWFTEKAGKISRLNPDQKIPEPGLRGRVSQ